MDHANWIAVRAARHAEADRRLFLPRVVRICVVPWLTMVGRSALAVLVSRQMAMYCVMWFAGEIIGVVTFGQLPSAAADIRALRMTVMWNGTLAVCAVSAIAAWITFTRLQAGDGGGVPIDFWRRRRDRENTAREGRLAYRLMQLSGNATTLDPTTRDQGTSPADARAHRRRSLCDRGDGIARSRAFLPEELRIPLVTVTNVYGGLVAIIIGAFASAEERQLGTAAWQNLMPVAAWKQWTVKVGVVLLLALTLGAGLPKLLELITPGVSPFFDKMDLGQLRFVPMLAIAVLHVCPSLRVDCAHSLPPLRPS